MKGIKKILLMSFLLVLCIGCANGANEAEKRGNGTKTNEFKDPATPEYTKQLRANEQTNRPTKEEKQSKKDKNNNQENNLSRADYTNKQTNQMEKRLLKEEDVQVAQVAMTDKTIFVALKMNHNHRPKIKEIARDIVMEDYPNKEIIITTNLKEWDHLRNENARNIPLNINKWFTQFFK